MHAHGNANYFLCVNLLPNVLIYAEIQPNHNVGFTAKENNTLKNLVKS